MDDYTEECFRFRIDMGTALGSRDLHNLVVEGIGIYPDGSHNIAGIDYRFIDDQVCFGKNSRGEDVWDDIIDGIAIKCMVPLTRAAQEMWAAAQELGNE